MDQNINSLFPARITRAACFFRGILLLLGGLVGGGMISLSEHGPLVFRIVFVAAGAGLLVFLFVALFRSILIPRIRDMGLHPAWSLLIFVHALNTLFLLALFLIPTDAFAKRSYTTFR